MQTERNAAKQPRHSALGNAPSNQKIAGDDNRKNQCRDNDPSGVTRKLLAENLTETRLTFRASSQNLLVGIAEILLTPQNVCRCAPVEKISDLLIKNLPAQMVGYLEAQQ